MTSYWTYYLIQQVPVCGHAVLVIFLYCGIFLRCCIPYIDNKIDVILKNCSRPYFNTPHGPFNRLLTAADVIRDGSNRPVRKRVYKLVGAYVIMSVWHALAMAWNVLIIEKTNTCDQRYDCFAYNQSSVEAVDCTLVEYGVPVDCFKIAFSFNQALGLAGGIIIMFSIILSAVRYVFTAVSAMCGGKCARCLRIVLIILSWCAYCAHYLYYANTGKTIPIQPLLAAIAYWGALHTTLWIPWEKITDEEVSAENNASSNDSHQNEEETDSIKEEDAVLVQEEDDGTSDIPEVISTSV